MTPVRFSGKNTPNTADGGTDMHKIIARRDHKYPFKPYWACNCGIRMQSTVMGHELYREFAAHQEEVKDK